MAHIDKYSRQELRKVLKEIYREYDDQSKYVNEVDPSRTHLNYSMRFHSSYEFMNALDDRVADLIDETMGGKPPKNDPKFGSWIITAPRSLYGDFPNDYDADLLKLFFTTFYEFCQERYGKDNVIDGTVHMDETSPHMTVYIVPECISRKSGNPTISAATLFQREELRMFHADFDKVCEKVFGVPNLVVRTEEERAGDQKSTSLAEYKLTRSLADAMHQIQVLQDQLKCANEKPVLTKDQAKVLAYVEEHNLFQTFIDDYDRTHSETHDDD